VFFLLTDPISHLPGVGPNSALKWQKLGVLTVEDLLHYYPRKWEDLSTISPLMAAQAGQKITVKAQLKSISHFRSPRKSMFITNAVIQDESAPIRVVWFNQPYLQTSLKKDEEYYFSGAVGI